MDKKKSKQLLAVLAACYWGLALLVYLVAGEQFRYTGVTTDALSPVAAIGEMTDGVELRQRMEIDADRLDGVQLMIGTYGRENEGELIVSVESASGEVLAQQSAALIAMEDGKYNEIAFAQPVESGLDEALTLVITAKGCRAGDAVTLYYGNMVSTGRFEIAQSIAQEDLFRINGETGMGKLCVKAEGTRFLSLYKTYWIILPAVFLLLSLYAFKCWKEMAAGRNNLLSSICTVYTRYTFLLKQLVIRDFKAKYKRSALGVVWSFLNPLLTMSVQYVVFSTLFRNDTPNYPVYLLTGIVFFNYFNEAVSTGMTAITGNASLIKKVYMPKYIYPVSKILSSSVNFLLALIPLALVMLFTGTAFRPALLLLVFDILCMLGFVMGMAMLLSTFMTFFQDTQFLWNVLSMMWMYVTPVFYTENIIPSKFHFIYHMNPMYQYITFARTVIIDGVSPAPAAYLCCMLCSAVALALGMYVFKKHQDKFVLYL